jgi:hypothetical protein
VITAANPIIMYTKNGVVSNQQLIRGLIIRKFVDDYFSQTDKTILSRDSISLPVALSIDENKKSVIITKKTYLF